MFWFVKIANHPASESFDFHPRRRQPIAMVFCLVIRKPYPFRRFSLGVVSVCLYPVGFDGLFVKPAIFVCAIGNEMKGIRFVI
jgi:hypothetical protein